ncbi:proline/glycine betaine ABC transporter substrate-binding protein ProX [Acuticoccus sediminis]|uniref:Proline/glycine betaine ABC transporter substrate-binding protein ProX n=1 Tax=Acuticoccus sediminis TaxID=2184697 RepID=A0A8B2NIG7_9HYPH|nr:glycine betaine/L-proline ABC transporter substrate-binding protein ProX [Acuticoccus sediminis]RAH96831.1 proline/glycine betaine ABC transporter substrate-binding protein ProX [Acuticoccus sediminis]
MLRLHHAVRAPAMALTLAAMSTAPLMAQESLPGEGVTVSFAYDSTAETLFQTNIVQIGLERLGYEVEAPTPLQIPAMYLATSTGDVDAVACAWKPLQNAFYERAGGDSSMVRLGALVEGATQGYFIDKATAEAHDISSIDQLQDPEIAALFSADGSGKAQLFGCPPGWGCERVIEHQMDAYELRPTVDHVQGDMAVIASEILARHASGEPVVYYTYMPLWVSQILVPGEDVVQLTVPFTSLPESDDPTLTTLPDGRNVGHTVNTIGVIANKGFAEDNPVAAKWMELVTIPVADVVAENYRIYEGEKSDEAIRAHAVAWVEEHAEQFDAWLAEAKAAQ